MMSFSIFSQDIPSEFPYNYVFNLKLDVGDGWSNNKMGLISWQDLNQEAENQDSVFFGYRTGSGLFINQSSISYSPYFYGRSVIFKNFYMYLFSSAISGHEETNVDGFSGKKLERSRFGLSSAETDLAGIGFKNQWLKLQYGRGRELIGKNNKINLILTEDSPSYDYGLIGFQYKKIQTKYFHGFLENKNNINRYINGRSIAYNNNNNFIFSLSEIIIYSGLNRTIDLAYLNPIASHLEIEFNDRQNIPNSGSGNAVWLVSSDYLYNSVYRFTANILIDEFIIDSKQKNEGKNNGIGYSFRLSRAWEKENSILGVNAHYLNIGSKVFRHENGYNNFISRGKPLGWKYGSNGLEYGFNVYYLFFKKIIAEINYGKRIIGEESIIFNSYERYDNYNSLNNIIAPNYNLNYLNINFDYWIGKNFTASGKIELISKTPSKLETKVTLGLDIYINN